MPADVIVEILVDGTVSQLPAIYDTTAIEVYVDEPVAVEVVAQMPQQNFKIGGTDPTDDPTVLVWYKLT